MQNKLHVCGRDDMYQTKFRAQRAAHSRNAGALGAEGVAPLLPVAVQAGSQDLGFYPPQSVCDRA